MRTLRIWQSVVSAALIAGAMACSDGSGIAPTTTIPVTETFEGTLARGEIGLHTFTAPHVGSIRVTLTKAGPPDNVQLFLGIGAPQSDGSCLLVQTVYGPAGPNPQLSGSNSSAGDLCLAIFDNDDLVETITYSISVVHPS